MMAVVEQVPARGHNERRRHGVRTQSYKVLAPHKQVRTAVVAQVSVHTHTHTLSVRGVKINLNLKAKYSTTRRDAKLEEAVEVDWCGPVSWRTR